MTKPPRICAGCGNEINGEPYCVEVHPTGPDLMGVMMYFCEASHYGEQLEEPIEPSIAEGNE